MCSRVLTSYHEIDSNGLNFRKKTLRGIRRSKWCLSITMSMTEINIYWTLMVNESSVNILYSNYNGELSCQRRTITNFIIANLPYKYNAILVQPILHEIKVDTIHNVTARNFPLQAVLDWYETTKLMLGPATSTFIRRRSTCYKESTLTD